LDCATEWNITDAYVKDSRGQHVIDFRQSDLHVLNYSMPVFKRMSLGELRPRLFTMPDDPEWIPYRTSYYNENWGFCLSHNQLAKMQDEEYEVCIDSSLKPGFLTYGEYFIPGNSSDEVERRSQHEAEAGRIKLGLIVASVGAGDKFTYKKGGAVTPKSIGRSPTSLVILASLTISSILRRMVMTSDSSVRPASIFPSVAS
jgi:Domain of unknown function (DUF2172)